MTKHTTRKRRIIRALTPKRIRRAQTRWRRRRQKVTRGWTKFREVVRRDPRVRCGACGMQVAPGKLKGHLARHDAQAAKAEAGGRRRRARHAPAAAPPRPRKAPAEPLRPKCDGTCTNSDMDDAEADARGLCNWCYGSKELITNFDGKHVHVPCSMCNASGRAASSKAGSKARGTATGQGGLPQDTDPQRPSKAEAGRKTAGWFLVAAALFGTAFVIGGGLWMAAAGLFAMAAGASAYRYERNHGTSDHAGQSDRKATKQAARAAGCSSACMWSIRPADTCRCPCGGSTHGSAHRKKAAA